ncbi:MAG: pallilysin-related adhesin [Spirochaetales bacterium]|nr:pallilysin-related adhesin [Spirochaetales bacterium]
MYRILIVLLAVFCALTACDGAQPRGNSGGGLVPATPGELDKDRFGSVSTSVAPEVEAPEPVIQLKPELALVGLANVNFDLERNEEQVLAVRNRTLIDSPVRIIVAAYDSVLETYRVVFEADTLATNQRAFSFSFLDIVGDHNLEIVCRGMDDSGRQTLDVFHRTVAPSGFGLYYSSIFSVALSGSIEIVELERSGAYQVGQANGDSFPIVTQTQDKESDNMLDLVQTTYYWRFTEGSYIEGKTEKIPGEEVEQEQLRELYRKNAAAFTDFLNGNWYLAEDGEEPVEGNVILNFDTAASLFTYYTGELQESYTWVSTYKVLVSRVEINGENELVPFIRKQFYLQVESLDSIQIRAGDPWSGLYRRLSEQVARSLSGSKYEYTESPALAGLFYSDAGHELSFDGHSFRLIESGQVYQGGYAFYNAAAPVLELRILNRAGLVIESRKYRYSYVEEKRDDRIFRTLSLVRGIVGIYGFEATSDNVLRFEQITTATEG